jgi:hypothetical protein
MTGSARPMNSMKAPRPGPTRGESMASWDAKIRSVERGEGAVIVVMGDLE